MSQRRPADAFAASTLQAAAPRGGTMPLIVRDTALPKQQGAYDPARERDACGVGVIADMHDRRTHAIVEQGLKILEN
nr:hypothetical protein [Escherichia coli]